MSTEESKFDLWWSSPETKRIVGAAYSLGAAVVIIGAMFKILHLPGAPLMLGLGMSVEAVLFSLGILDKPHKDYDWDNQSKVKTFADTWVNYPNIMDENAREIDCTEWGCTHIGYMKWWFTHLPHYQGISSKDKKLNNWWGYVVDYNEAIRLEKQ